MAFATSSLPVPLSPVMSTVERGGRHRADQIEDGRHGRGDAQDALEAVAASGTRP